jgi:hypothetical protein
MIFPQNELMLLNCHVAWFFLAAKLVLTYFTIFELNFQFTDI